MQIIILRVYASFEFVILFHNTFEVIFPAVSSTVRRICDQFFGPFQTAVILFLPDLPGVGSVHCEWALRMEGREKWTRPRVGAGVGGFGQTAVTAVSVMARSHGSSRCFWHFGREGQLSTSGGRKEYMKIFQMAPVWRHHQITKFQLFDFINSQQKKIGQTQLI